MSVIINWGGVLMVTENWIAKKLGGPVAPRVSFANVYDLKNGSFVGSFRDSREECDKFMPLPSYRLRIAWKD